MARLNEGDVITTANGRRIKSKDDLDQVLNSKKDLVVLHIERAGNHYIVPLNKDK